MLSQEKLRKLFIKIRSPGESQFKPFGTIQLDLAQFTATNGAQELSLGVSDCIVVAAIVSLRITYVQGSQDLNPEPSVSSTKVETSSIPKSIPENHGPSPSPSVLSHAIDSPNPSNHSVERRNSVQRRSSVRGIISQLDEADGEEERANRATKELVERIQKQNEEYKKTNHALKSQLDSLTEQLIESNLQKAELLTNIDHEILEKRRLQQRLRWYEWSTDIWAYLDSTLFHPTTSSQLESRPEPPPEELLDTE